MKIAISSTGQTLDSPVDARFGRARAFVVYDTDTGEHEAISNEQNLNAPQGAGVQAAQLVAETGAAWALTGHCGPKAFRALSAADIRVATGVQGTVEDAVKQFQEGKCTPASDADVDSHWA